MTKRRLVLCLDGTWNNRDDTTNVLHHFALALSGQPPGATDSVNQIKYYHEGVGTGVLDGISGGAFGFGLEENVRGAYDWLVEQYRDGDNPDLADEVYIFGFSRGAYTARSLVGFIVSCGLLRRGAPLSVNQLWDDYCILGREREHRTSFWDTVFGEDKTDLRRITDLICDPWNIARYEEKRAKELAENPSAHDSIANRLPGQLTDLRNARERLLVHWARRIRITYLGVYDTVGALGIDALAIPGIRSKLAMHHNMRASTLVQNCRHALAIDEHRSSFSHTPFLEYVGHGNDEDDNQRSAMKADDAETHWKKAHAMWRRKIEQRWFVGAHSNVGGGYPDNELAQLPLKWLLEGAQALGLQSEAFTVATPMAMPPPRDSFAEFAKPFWTQIIRGKRYYRTIDPPPDIRASPPDTKAESDRLSGFTLQTIHEEIDPSVFQHFEANGNYRPPNVVEYARRKLRENSSDNAQALADVATKEPKHTWLGDTVSAHLNLVLWGTFTAFGLVTLYQLFSARVDPVLAPWLLGLTAFVFVLIDWGESAANFSLAAGPSSARWRAFLDSIYWIRTLGFVLFSFGVIATLAHVWAIGWHAGAVQDALGEGVGAARRWWSIPSAAALAVIVGNLLDRAPLKRQKSGLVGAAIGIIVAIGGAVIVVLMAWLLAQIFAPIFGHAHPLKLIIPAEEAQRAGLLLLLQLALICFLNTFAWVGEPMSRANLGSIVALQRCYTPESVAKCLEKWRLMLACRWGQKDQDATNGPAAQTMRETVREALWRDIFGYIPVYFFVFTFGLWFAAHELAWPWLNLSLEGIPAWLLLPMVAAVADYIEDFCHLRYIFLYERKAVPSFPLSLFCCAMTGFKFAALATASLLTVAAVILGSWEIASLGEKTGWRGTVALLISALTVFAIAVIAICATLYRLRSRNENS